MEIGKYNTLTVNRLVDFGAYLTDNCGNEVLLPARYIGTPLRVGDPLKVFVYTDSEDRPIATTEHPFATVGELAYLTMTDVNETGAFLDWGLSKNLLVPYREQRSKMKRGGEYLVYVYLDNATGRVVATAKYEKYINNLFPDYKPFEKVNALIVGHHERGYKVVVNNLHSGIIYSDEVYRSLEIGEQVVGYVKKIREDGKLDLTLLPPAGERTENIAALIIERLKRHGGEDEIGDFLSPDYIAASFQCSKKDFKRAVGLLLKTGKVAKTDGGLRLLSEK